MHKPFLDPANLSVTSFETQSEATLSPNLLVTTGQTKLPTTDPTAETRCFYCPIDYTFDCAVL